MYIVSPSKMCKMSEAHNMEEGHKTTLGSNAPSSAWCALTRTPRAESRSGGGFPEPGLVSEGLHTRVEQR